MFSMETRTHEQRWRLSCEGKIVKLSGKKGTFGGHNKLSNYFANLFSFFCNSTKQKAFDFFLPFLSVKYEFGSYLFFSLSGFNVQKKRRSSSRLVQTIPYSCINICDGTQSNWCGEKTFMACQISLCDCEQGYGDEEGLEEETAQTQKMG